jgi:hypothetical protein
MAAVATVISTVSTGMASGWCRRSLAEAKGSYLLLSSTAPVRFTVFLPLHDRTVG